MKSATIAFFFAGLVIVGGASAAQPQLSKGHRLLIENGLQIQGMTSRDHPFEPEKYFKANYTAINWIFVSDVSKHGPAPGVPWARWIGNENDMPPVGDEKPYMPKLIALSYGDEKDLNDPAVRDPYIKWFNDTQANYPNTILYANNYGGQVNDAALHDFVSRAKPDMICFDTYPWRSDYQSRRPAPPAGGSPTTWYSELRRYREHARQANGGAGIPLGTYRQSFHAVQDYDATVYRDPSLSEFRLNTFAALAFNVKFLIDFTYNNGASSFFKSVHGDREPAPLYEELRIANRQARNLGKALVHLKPVQDAKTPDMYTTGMMFIRGKHRTGPDAAALNAIPIGFVPDGADPSYTDWESNRNDPFLRGWSVKNLGKHNAGLPGDVIISWFKVLDESLDGEAWKDEVYVIVTNGLCDMNAAPAQTRQQIKLNFDFGKSGITSVQGINRQTGKVEEVKLPVVGNRRQMVLELDGGTAELFKFKTGAPFVGH